MLHSANEIAEWIVRHSADDLGAPVDPMSLEKLIYYAQAIHLALTDEPLFQDEIEAWKWGPVVRDVYTRYAVFGADPITLLEEEFRLPSQTEAFLSQIVAFFRRHTAFNLSQATHLEAPWHDANPSDTISQSTMKIYYKALIEDGEKALSRLELLNVISEPRWSSFYVAGICSRKMSKHPFYDSAWAKELATPMPPAPKLPREFFSPVKGRDFVEFGDDDDVEEKFRQIVSRG
jgi:uncharacterized phage-associated protein